MFILLRGSVKAATMVGGEKNFEIWHSKNGKKSITIISMASIRKNFLFNNYPFVGF